MILAGLLACVVPARLPVLMDSGLKFAGLEKTFTATGIAPE
jgi:hypothetical protein